MPKTVSPLPGPYERAMATTGTATMSAYRPACPRRASEPMAPAPAGGLRRRFNSAHKARNAPSASRVTPRETCDDQNHFETAARSEEHTSELQSRENLVCRLLLEKKNKKY